MKLQQTLFLVLLTLGLVSTSQAQVGQFNFFVGEDADQVQTSIKGFGSFNNTGYLNAQVAFPFNTENKSSLFAGGGLAFYYKKFRFRDNLILNNVNGDLVITEDIPDYYTDGFFSYSKSKLVVFTATVQPEIGFSVNKGKFAIGIAPRFDFALAAKHKRKFKVNDEKMKFKDTGVSKYDINPIQMGVNARVGTLKRGIEVSYMLSTFFASANSPQVQTVSIGIYQRILPTVDKD